jgi:hypothetical protein
MHFPLAYKKIEVTIKVTDHNIYVLMKYVVKHQVQILLRTFFCVCCLIVVLAHCECHTTDASVWSVFQIESDISI